MSKHTIIRTIAIVGGMAVMTVSTIIQQKRIGDYYKQYTATLINKELSELKKES